MSGPEHYREAERLLALAPAVDPVAEAHVHAILALVAAAAEKRDHLPLQDWGGTSTELEYQHRWDEVIR